MPPAGRPRNTARQAEAGAAARRETRRRLLDSAAREFETNGYHATTVTTIAVGAGVTVQTLYLAWGSKAALLRAYFERAITGPLQQVPAAEAIPALAQSALDGAEGDPRRMLRAIARYQRRTAERVAIGWQLYRDAAAADAEVAADWRRLQQLRHGTMSGLIGRLPARTLRPGLTRKAAADTAWAILAPQTYELMVDILGYSLDAYEKWAAVTLIHALLPEADSSTR